MKHTLTFGYIGKEFGNINSSTTHKKHKEPILSIDKIIKFFNLESKDAKIDVDLDLVYQGQSKQIEEKIKKIWKNLIFKKWKWNNLKRKLSNLLELGDNLLPLVFDMHYDNINIEIVDGEHTILIISDDIDKLKRFKNLIEKESEERTSPYGRIGDLKITLKSMP